MLNTRVHWPLIWQLKHGFLLRILRRKESAKQPFTKPQLVKALFQHRNNVKDVLPNLLPITRDYFRLCDLGEQWLAHVIRSVLGERYLKCPRFEAYAALCADLRIGHMTLASRVWKGKKPFVGFSTASGEMDGYRPLAGCVAPSAWRTSGYDTAMRCNVIESPVDRSIPVGADVNSDSGSDDSNDGSVATTSEVEKMDFCDNSDGGDDSDGDMEIAPEDLERFDIALYQSSSDTDDDAELSKRPTIMAGRKRTFRNALLYDYNDSDDEEDEMCAPPPPKRRKAGFVRRFKRKEKPSDADVEKAKPMDDATELVESRSKRSFDTRLAEGVIFKPTERQIGLGIGMSNGTNVLVLNNGEEEDERRTILAGFNSDAQLYSAHQKMSNALASFKDRSHTAFDRAVEALVTNIVEASKQYGTSRCVLHFRNPK